MKKSKKIIIIGRYVATFGGAHKYLGSLNKRLIDAGNSVWIGMNITEANAQFVGELQAAGATVFELPFDARPALENALVLDREIADIGPDVIDCEVAAHVVRDTILLSEGFRSSPAKKIFTMHLAIKSEKLPESIYDKYFPWSPWNKSLGRLRRFLGCFDSGISVSDYHAARVSKILKIQPEFFTFIANGVDVAEFPVVQRDAEKDKVVIGGCGSLSTQKRFDLLISATKELVKAGMSLECRIAGEGPEREKLEAQIRELGLSEIVRLEGHCSDVPTFLQQLDIFVMCSDNEGFPYAQLEAMASGLPSVVTQVGDLPILVEHQRQGFVVERRNVTSLVTSLESLTRDGNLRLKYGREAREKIERDFDADHQEQLTLNYFVS
ncbi:MAG: glycosyltransferase family 4 protein [Pseudomonadota bacterium]